MKTSIQIYSNMVAKVKFFFKQLHLNISKSTGRKLAISPEETIALSLFKQKQNIETKKSVWEIFRPPCSYKTLVVSMNRWMKLALAALALLLRINRTDQHLIKHTDSTDIPVCRKKNA